jgi:hypothetical protein
MTTLKIPTFPIPSDRELDARVAREFWNEEVRMLPAHQEPECGSIQVWDPEHIESTIKELEEHGPSLMSDLLKWHSATPWQSVEGMTCGQYPCVLVKAVLPEHRDYWGPLPHYSTSISDAWQLIDLIRETEGPLRSKFLDRLGDLRLFLMDYDTPKAICLAALEATGEKHEKP